MPVSTGSSCNSDENSLATLRTCRRPLQRRWTLFGTTTNPTTPTTTAILLRNTSYNTKDHKTQLWKATKLLELAGDGKTVLKNTTPKTQSSLATPTTTSIEPNNNKTCLRPPHAAPTTTENADHHHRTTNYTKKNQSKMTETGRFQYFFFIYLFIFVYFFT
jgi:hypothetical protein